MQFKVTYWYSSPEADNSSRFTVKHNAATTMLLLTHNTATAEWQITENGENQMILFYSENPAVVIPIHNIHCF
jgi:hypothetical protein